MSTFSIFTASCLPLREENIDTDQIVPARFLKITTRDGFGKYMFYDWRYDTKEKHVKKSIFNDSKYKNSKILVAGNNFGCGSSREHAAWAILDYGYRVVISSSFGDIFYNNSLKNRLLPVVIKSKELEILFRLIEKVPGFEITVDLEKQTISDPIVKFLYHFDIDAFRKKCLLKGVDELGYILSHEDKINTYESKGISK